MVLARIFLLIFLLCRPFSAWAVPEASLLSLSGPEIIPFFSDQFRHSYFTGSAGVKIAFSKREIDDERAALVVVSGRTEYSIKYSELLYDLKDQGLSLYIYDHRGQGSSGRLLADSQKGHVDDFDYYVNDLQSFIEQVVLARRHQKLFVLAHSMGGTVASLYAQQHQGQLAGLILCSPMLGLDLRLPVKFVGALARTMRRLGGGSYYVWGRGGYDSERVFVDNDLTHSQVRFVLNNTLVDRFPVNAIGGPTFGWVDESLRAMAKVKASAAHLKTPTLLLQAGEDTVVDRLSQDEVCRAFGQCTLVTLAGARHELLMESDVIRQRVLARIRIFIERFSR